MAVSQRQQPTRPRRLDGVTQLLLVRRQTAGDRPGQDLTRRQQEHRQHLGHRVQRQWVEPQGVEGVLLLLAPELGLLVIHVDPVHREVERVDRLPNQELLQEFRGDFERGRFFFDQLGQAEKVQRAGLGGVVPPQLVRLHQRRQGQAFRRLSCGVEGSPLDGSQHR